MGDAEKLGDVGVLEPSPCRNLSANMLNTLYQSHAHGIVLAIYLLCLLRCTIGEHDVLDGNLQFV